MAARPEVIVRVQWADPERSGLRTLRLRARSLDRVCRGIAKGVGGLVTVEPGEPEIAGEAPVPQDPGGATARFVAAAVESVGEIPAGHLLPAMTLMRVRAGQRRVFLRLAGTHEFEIGTRVYLAGLDSPRSVFDAELVSGASTAPFFFELRPWAV